MCEKEEKSIKVDELFCFGLQLKLGQHFCQEPPLKNPGSATAPAPDLRMENYRLI